MSIWERSQVRNRRQNASSASQLRLPRYHETSKRTLEFYKGLGGNRSGEGGGSSSSSGGDGGGDGGGGGFGGGGRGGADGGGSSGGSSSGSSSSSSGSDVGRGTGGGTGGIFPAGLSTQGNSAAVTPPGPMESVPAVGRKTGVGGAAAARSVGDYAL